MGTNAVKPKLNIVMTCHNRKEKTLKCLKTLNLEDVEQVNVHVVMVDDGSTDGTTQAVQEQFPTVTILQGDGNLFWNRGMHKAFSKAVEMGADFYLWINDDVEFYSKAIDKLIQAYKELSHEKKDTIVVGPTMDEEGQYNTYGGFGRKKSIKPYETQRIFMSDSFQPCLVFHGNCVLIPQVVVDIIGINDPYYQHGYGDADYSLMAAKAGCACWLANFPIGTCERHDETFAFEDTTLPLKKRLDIYHSVMHCPPHEQKYFSKKFFGIWWFYKYLSGDIRIIISALKNRNQLKGIDKR